MATLGKISIADIDKQIAEYKMDAEAGDAGAHFFLGVCYEKGTGVAIDMRLAFKWYKRAAEAGIADAQAILGSCYDFGKGIAVDQFEAFKWYRG